MKHGGKVKIFGAGVFFLLLIATVGSMGVATKKNTPQPLGILEFDPQSHDFGNMSEGEINSTIFDIWTSGGCCELIFNLTWDCEWITVFPTSGVTNGEHIPITVTIDTTGLENGFHGCDIQITTNGGGDGVFNVTVNVISHLIPWLAFYPQSHYFGVIPANITQSTTFDVWNSGAGTLSYTVSCADSWVDVTPTEGTSTGEHDPITVTIDTTGLDLGTTYQSYIHIDSNGGNKMFLAWFVVGTEPKIEIKSISGGFFRITSVIANTGTTEAIGVDWTISLSGNGFVLLGKETTGKLTSLPVGEVRTITSGPILGLGDVIVTVYAQNSEALPIMGQKPAKLLLFYIKM
jgi:hypothetical protein